MINQPPSAQSASKKIRGMKFSSLNRYMMVDG
jgi:hypothetical protein